MAATYTYEMKAQGVTLTPPAPATLAVNGFANYSVLSFQEEFDDTASICGTATILAPGNRTYPATFVGQQTNVAGPQPGYNWYAQAFGWLDTIHGALRNQDIGDGSGIQYMWPEYYFIAPVSGVASVLNIRGHNPATERDTAGALLSTATVDTHQAYVGTTIDFANGFFVESRARVPVFNAASYFDIWVAEMAYLLGHNAVYNDINAPECLNAGNNGQANTIDMVVNLQNAGSGSSYNPGGNHNNLFITDSTVTTTFHTYGCLFVPPVGNTFGFVHFFFNGVEQSQMRVPVPPPGQGGGTAEGANNSMPLCRTQQLRLTVGTGDTGFSYIDYIRVWQQTATG